MTRPVPRCPPAHQLVVAVHSGGPSVLKVSVVGCVCCAGLCVNCALLVVDEEYEKLRKEKERERESLRHKIELQKKEQARAEALEAEERRVLRAKELEKQAKETEQRQSVQSAEASAEEKSQRMEAKKHREELRRSMEEIRERRRSEARNRPPLEGKEKAPACLWVRKTVWLCVCCVVRICA